MGGFFDAKTPSPPIPRPLPRLIFAGGVEKWAITGVVTPPSGRAGERCDPYKHVRHSVSRGVMDSNGYVIGYSIAIIKTLWQMLVLV